MSQSPLTSSTPWSISGRTADKPWTKNGDSGKALDVRFGKARHKNMGSLEAWLSLAGGSGLIWSVLRKRSAGSLPLAAVGGLLLYRGATGNCPVYSAAGIDHSEHNSGPDAIGVITINKPAEELYRYWRNLSNAPTFMSFVDQVDVLDEKTSRWRGRTPAGYSIDYTAEIVEDIPNQGLRWRSVEGAPIQMRGSVRLVPAPTDRGTSVVASVVFGGNQSGGSIRGRLARPFANYTIHEDLMRFKQLMETGEIATTEGQPSGRENAERARPAAPSRRGPGSEMSQPRFEHIASS